MTNKNYNSGRKFEYRVKKYLEKKGYYVMRSAGSKSPFDLIAIPSLSGNILLIQCKHGTKISKQERNKIKVLGFSFTGRVICLVAWSKLHGDIEFYWWNFQSQYEWVKREGL